MSALRPFVIWPWLLALALAGCAITPQPKLSESEQQQLATAQDLERRQQIDAAIAAWRTLAATAPQPLASRFALRPVELLIDVGRVGEAEQALAALPIEQIAPEEQDRHLTLQAQIELEQGKTFEALSDLPEPTEQMATDLQARILGISAQGLAQIGQPLASVRTRVQREPLLTDIDAISENQRALWETLSTIPVPELEQALSEQPGEGLRGWLELGLSSRRAQFDPEALEQVIASWMQRYPGHPAADSFVFFLLEQAKLAALRPKRIALLLPLSGRLAEAGRAVMHGLFSAWYSDELERPEIVVRDTAAVPEGILTLYNTVIDTGADLVIGPLDKAMVSTLARSPAVRVPTLTLNYAEESFGEKPEIAASLDLFQFGLLPEDEARQLADLAIARDHRHAVALTPATEWGDRLVLAFRERYEILGGQLLEQERYPAQENDFSSAIERLLNLDASDRRYRRLVQILGMQIEFEPRRRQDVDAIFIAANPRQGRLIRPQLRFHRAADLPVYATSHVSSGIDDIQADRDLDGIIYTEMPWTLKSTQLPEYLELASLWPKEMERFANLFALGSDAYRVVPYLRRMQALPEERVAGNTGVLYMDDRGRIHRDLLFATFERGQRRPFEIERGDDALAPETAEPHQEY
jgi:outer membrane PBP1 activator LpoA protein